jgi:hypothetical protein
MDHLLEILAVPRPEGLTAESHAGRSTQIIHKLYICAAATELFILVPRTRSEGP